MENKQPIDQKRERGGAADIGTNEEGAIVELINISERLIVVKERAIYESFNADTVDPDRTNIALPNLIHKLIIDQGAESELVSRIFLQAKTIFKNRNYGTIDIGEVLFMILALLEEFIVLEKEINEFLNEDTRVTEQYNAKRSTNTSYSIPTITNLETRCKTMIQKADHIEQTLIQIIVKFYPNEGLTKQSHFPKLHQVVEKKYGGDDDFTKQIDSALSFMRVVRELRNGLDHQLDSVTVTNFDLQASGEVFSPSITLNHKDTKLERISLSVFLPLLLKNFVSITESVLLFLAAKNIQQKGLQSKLLKIPAEKRRFPHVRYAFWLPIGDEGFYQQ